MILFLGTTRAYGQGHQKPYVDLVLLPGTYSFGSGIAARVRAYDMSGVPLASTTKINIVSGNQTKIVASGEDFVLPSDGLPVGENSVTASVIGLDADNETEKAYLIKTVIKRDGTPITATQNVMVGEKMNLSVDLEGAPNGALWSPAWIVPPSPNTVKDWYSSHTYGQRSDLNNTDVTSTSLSFAWVTGGNQPVTCIVNLNNGASFSSLVSFNVTKPDYGFNIESTGTVELNTNHADPGGVTGIHFGTAAAPTAGVQYSGLPIPPLVYRQDIMLIQIINSQRSRRDNIGWQNFTPGGIALDNGGHSMLLIHFREMVHIKA